MKKLLSVLFLLSFTLASAVYAQDIQIKGTVVSGADNEPLPGVNVVVKGNATTGTITGIDGEFALSVPSDAILSISYIGFKSQDIPLNGKREFKIVLQEDAEALDEVVVVGYGVQKKSVVTAVRTFCPISPKQEERLIAVVDSPTPPFWFAIAIVLPKICIASFHLFVFHLQFFLFTGNDLPALLSKK